MKKYIPFVFPALALAIVVFLGYRWYTSQTVKSSGKISDFGEGVQIEDLSSDQINKLKKAGSKDLPSVVLKGDAEGAGQVRYEVANGKVAFTVSADLAAPKKGEFYQVWLKESNGDSKKKAFKLEFGKGGYVGWGAVSEDTIPFDVVVTKEKTDDDQMEAVQLSGSIQK